MSTSTSISTTLKDGKMVTTKTVTTVGANGEKKTETFIEEKESAGEGAFGSDFFKNRVRELKEDESSDDDGRSEWRRGGEVARPEASSAAEEELGEEGDFTKFQLEALEAHNQYRAKHGVPALRLSKSVCAYAQEWADRLLAEDRFEHRGEHKFGENLFSSWSSAPRKVSGAAAVESWYAEVQHYTFGQEPRGGPTTGHFTQLVWRESQQLGMGLAQRDGKVIVVGNYSPAGNFTGRYCANVPAPK